MLYERPLGDALTSAELSEEVIRTLVGSVGLVLAIPVTTLIAVLVVKATGIKALGGAAGTGRGAGGRTAVVPPAAADDAGPRPRPAPESGPGVTSAAPGFAPDSAPDNVPDDAFAAAPAGRRGRRAAARDPAFHIAGADPADLPGFETMNG
jgi:hypothetical protein